MLSEIHRIYMYFSFESQQKIQEEEPRRKAVTLQRVPERKFGQVNSLTWKGSDVASRKSARHATSQVCKMSPSAPVCLGCSCLLRATMMRPGQKTS